MAEAVKADCETGHIRGIFLRSVGGVDCGERWCTNAALYTKRHRFIVSPIM